MAAVPAWRPLGCMESFRYNYEPHAGIFRGYLMEADIILASHANCGCLLSKEQVRKQFFLQHSDEHHGVYPRARKPTGFQ